MKRITSLLDFANPLVILYLVMAALFIVLIVAVPTFRTMQNVNNLFCRNVPLLCVCLGQMIVMLAAGIDLTVGPVLALATATVVGRTLKTSVSCFQISLMTNLKDYSTVPRVSRSRPSHGSTSTSSSSAVGSAVSSSKNSGRSTRIKPTILRYVRGRPTKRFKTCAARTGLCTAPFSFSIHTACKWTGRRLRP